MYQLIKVISYLIRQFLLPNPFTNLFENSGMAEIINWIFGGVLVPLAYFLTGTWYDRDIKSIGSIGFLINYAILTGLILLITKYVFNIYLIVFLFILGYFLLCIIESKLLSR